MENAGYDQPQDPTYMKSHATQPPSYAHHHGNHQQQVSIPMAAPGMVVVHDQVRWSWCPMITSVFGFFCCTIFGLIAMLAAVTSYVDHKAKDFTRSANKRKLAYGFGIAAIVIGSLIFLILMLYSVLWNEVIHAHGS